ncbi:MAG TPA: SRPBCC family protein [Stellaceae bacterium]|nr:SRPBCC family protein [Stellaceae bacterium]
MEIEKSFEVACAPERVWDALTDVHLVAECLPGASIIGDLGQDRYRGRFSVKLGPLAAAFEGEVAIEHRPAERAGTVSGKGIDKGSSSRASGTLRYRVAPADRPERARVDVVCELALAGALAQFGKAAVIREIANRITTEFARNVEARLATSAASTTIASSPSAAPSSAAISSAAPAPFDAGRLAWSMLKNRLIAFLRVLFGR